MVEVVAAAKGQSHILRSEFAFSSPGLTIPPPDPPSIAREGPRIGSEESRERE